METRLHIQPNAAPVASFAPVRAGLLQRKCACDGFTGSAGQCDGCSRRAAGNSHDSIDVQLRQLKSPNATHDFSRIRVNQEPPPTPNRSISVDGRATRARNGFDGVFIDGPNEAPAPAPAKPAPKPPPAKPSAKCPTNVQVMHIEQLRDPNFGKRGMLTGIGAYALMEVSDSAGTDWDGTLIKETVKPLKNTCGARAREGCSNKSGEAVDFKVGADTKIIGTKVPTFRNSFYDLHMFTREISVLHELGKDTCEIQCQQTYQCGGKQIGPEFIIRKIASKDTVANHYDVTRITIRKEPKAAPQAAPATP